MAVVHYISSDEQAPAQAKKLAINTEVTKYGLLKALAESCQFPGYFGHNWDAAWDMLSDYACDDLLLDLRPASEINETELYAFIDLIADACELNGKPQLWIIKRDQIS
ncbi:barstar family protein [Suttonella sp. R2A3]|uniref:barstar family protein n=1 Tax=Suttonella sp. R2A3 TaxID=2908648 RepID=UPI001F38B88D|nr:barstar family protein [Suttonella sp. R2A3]UJF24805.1 barstar family protein [Suttonella sp. R2A3]